MEALAPYEEHLRTAFRMGFKRPSPIADNEKVADILAAAGGVFPRNWTCSHCLYRVWSEAGRLYFKTKEDMERAKAEEPKKLSASERMKAFWALKKKGNSDAKGTSEEN